MGKINNTKIESIEWCRVIAAIFVVFIHCMFPGKLGWGINCLARFAVPFFFAVSGYFSFDIDDVKIKRRIYGALKLNVVATVLYMLWGSYRVRYIDGGGRLQWMLNALSPAKISAWFVANENPFSKHLWYLSAILMCYLALLVYTKMRGKSLDYQPLYIVGACLCSIHIVISSIASALGLGVPIQMYRNALLFGLPMFVLGLFLHEYCYRIIEAFQLNLKKLVLVMMVGMGLSLLEWFGCGAVEMPIGTFLEVAALMLLLLSLPTKTNSGSWIVPYLGNVSTFIYITHCLWIELYYIYLQKYLSLALGTKEAYLQPLVIVAISLATGILWAWGKHMAQQICFGRIRRQRIKNG